MQRSSPGNTATAHVARAPTAPVAFARGSPPGLGPGGLCGIAVPQLSPPPPEAEPALRQLSRSGMPFDASTAFRVAAIQRPAGATRPAPSRRAEPTGLAHVLRMCGCRRRRATPSRSNHTPAPKIRSSNTGNFAPTRRDDGAWSGICQSFVFRKPAVSKSQETVQRLQGPRVAGKATRQAWAWGLGATQAEPSAKVALRLASHNLAPFPRPSGLSWKSGARPYTTLAK